MRWWLTMALKLCKRKKFRMNTITICGLDLKFNVSNRKDNTILIKIRWRIFNNFFFANDYDGNPRSNRWLITKIQSDIFYSPSMIIIIQRMKKKYQIITLTFVKKKSLCFELRLLNAVGAKIPLFSNEIQEYITKYVLLTHIFVGRI